MAFQRPEPGLRIGRKYELVERLGEGGMGVVWRARHITLGHQVAIKFLKAHAKLSEDARQRFELEARVSAELGQSSRHVAQVIDFGITDWDEPFLVSEFLPGENLAQALEQKPRRSLEFCASVTVQLCRALRAAHSKQVIHRDVKPANVFLCSLDGHPEPFVKLLDFGVAKTLVAIVDSATTREGAVAGSPPYLSPEQLRGDRVLGPAVDVWATGVVVYRTLTGELPFGEFDEGYHFRVLHQPPTPASELVAGLPKEFDAWLERALAKSPEFRFSSAEDLGDALAAIAGIADRVVSGPRWSSKPPRQQPTRSIRDAPTVADRAAELSSMSNSAVALSPPLRRDNRTLRIAAIAGLALVALGGLVVTAAGGLARRTPSATSSSHSAVSAAQGPNSSSGIDLEASPDPEPSATTGLSPSATPPVPGSSTPAAPPPSASTPSASTPPTRTPPLPKRRPGWGKLDEW